MNVDNHDLVFIVGLPGSGKTYLAKTLAGPNRVLIDDPKQAPIFEPNTRYVVTDPHLCIPRTFLQVSKLYPQAFYYLFTNKVEQCWVNTKNRNDGRDITYEYLLSLSNKYDPYQLAGLVTHKSIIEVTGTLNHQHNQQEVYNHGD
ncbi:hypothetical protein [Microcoleus phage My-WqHQDG]|nr:hypothetical protein [Microcoleus phage My-WqHQDG]